MSVTKRSRDPKRQLGQFLTPDSISSQMVSSLRLGRDTRVLEPSMGNGSFILPLIEAFLPFYEGTLQEKLATILTRNIWGVEIDQTLFDQCVQRIRDRWGYFPHKHNLILADYFTADVSADGVPILFDVIIGNPPFGGTFNPDIEDKLDAVYGIRDGNKIKKETYAFFLVKSIDALARGGVLKFICSDTFLTIHTMRGLRAYLINHGSLTINRLEHFSEETNHPMVVLSYLHGAKSDVISIDEMQITKSLLQKTGNLSLGIRPEWENYFDGPRMGDFFVATSGMTTGKNEYFVREIVDGYVIEPYDFEFFEEPVSLKLEIEKARLGKLSVRQRNKLVALESAGTTVRNLRLVKRSEPKRVPLPHEHYRYYNKGTSEIIYAAPSHAIFWKDDGDAVITYKKNGNWYLRGVGGLPYFLREGLTWQLIANRMHTRYLPTGYILDSGAPCAFPREGVGSDEIYFAIGWTLTNTCTRILKEVINHTKNIQSKDFERLPYPFWVSATNRSAVIGLVSELIGRANDGESFNHKLSVVRALDSYFEFPQQKNVQSYSALSKQSKLQY